MLKDISKSFYNQPILKDVNLEVRKGEKVVIIGPSGSGKTTLLRCMNYLERPDTGTVSIGNLTVDHQNASTRNILALRRETAMVFQNYNLFKNKTVLENVMEGMIVSQKKARQEAKEKSLSLLKQVGLTDKVHHYPPQLSGGQQQRVGIARALALNPSVILFDEPTSALDPEIVNEVLSIIKRIAKDGITMVIVTHEIEFARHIADTIVFMDDGVILEKGSPKGVLDHPRHERTKSFLKKLVHKEDQIKVGGVNK